MRVNPTNINKSTPLGLVHPGFNKFFRWVNGKLEPKDKNNPTLFEKTNGLVLNTTKTIWSLYLPLQIIGLFSERAGKLAKAFYGVCWSIVYSCYRPWKENREKLPEVDDKGKEIKGWVRTTHNANEHFRVGMGTIVSALYSGGAFGMLFAWLKGDDELFDKSAKVYSTGMFNQNQIFGSMNAAIVLKRFLFRNKSQPDMNNTHLPEVDRYSGDLKANAEVVDTALFIPNIITRGLDTLKLFGIKFGEGTQRLINTLNYVGYGNWAFRFGDVKRRQEGGGDLEPINKTLKGMAGTIDKTLHDVQKHSSVVFRWLLSGVSWTAAALELLGKPELAEKVFKWEGILERLHPTVAAWCIRNPVLNLFKKAVNNNQEITLHEQRAATSSEKLKSQCILKHARADREEEQSLSSWGIIDKDGNRMAVALQKVSPAVKSLAELAGIDPDRLQASIEYEISLIDSLGSPSEDVKAEGRRESNEALSDGIRRVASELYPEWAVCFALKRELGCKQSGRYHDYNKLQKSYATAVGC